jgi:hypothetical protein
MVLALVCAEEVREDVAQPTETTIPKEETIVEEEKGEFQVNNGLKVVLEDVLDLTTGGMEMHGFKRHVLIHPINDYDIEYFVKGSNVIMADYHGTNSLKIEVLGRREADMILSELNS